MLTNSVECRDPEFFLPKFMSQDRHFSAIDPGVVGRFAAVTTIDRGDNVKVNSKSCIRSSTRRVGVCDGRLAQLVRAPALQAGGRRFESCTAHQIRHRNSYYGDEPGEPGKASRVTGRHTRKRGRSSVG